MAERAVTVPSRRPRARVPAVLATVLAALVVALAGCTGVPTGGAPQSVEGIGAEQQSNVPAGPSPGTFPSNIVPQFLAVNDSAASKHATARLYLTPQARNGWSDSTATIIANERPDVYDTVRHTVTVSGRKVGTLNSNGVYTPTRDGIGHGGATFTFTYHLTRRGDEYRISQLPQGLLLTEEQFQSSYEQRVLYFFDASNTYLVPDVRYSSVDDDPQQTANWMLDQLVQGPSAGLASIVSSALPAQPQRLSARVTSAATTVQIPGSRQLGDADRNRLATQVGLTLSRAIDVKQMTIMDGQRSVEIPKVRAARFSAADFTSALGPARPAPDVFYLRGGRVRTDTGTAVRGPFGNDGQQFDAVAAAQPTTVGELLFAATRGPQNQQVLSVGPQDGPIRQVPLPLGPLTRPAWAPGRAEIWIGAGSNLYRITTNGRTNQVSRVQVTVAGGGPLLAVRLSPDGSRVALVVSGANGQPQLYVGGLVRSGRNVQVEQPTQINPDGVAVTDVAWIDPLKLYAIGYLRGSTDAEVFRTNVDGANWDNQGISNLAKPPDSITMAQDAAAWVSAEGYVWEQNGSRWVSPVSTTGGTTGDNPIYLE